MSLSTIRVFLSSPDRANQGAEYLSGLRFGEIPAHSARLERFPAYAMLTIWLDIPEGNSIPRRDVRRLMTAAHGFDGSVDVESGALNAPGRRVVCIAFEKVDQACLAQEDLNAAKFKDDEGGGTYLATDLAGNVFVTFALYRKDGLSPIGIQRMDLGKLIGILKKYGGRIDEIRRCEVPRH